MIKNTSFLYSRRARVSNHKTRMKKHLKRKFNAADWRFRLKWKLLYFWNTNNVSGWTETMFKLNYKDLAYIRTIKRSCLYSDRCRSVNRFLGLSKYKIADFSRKGFIKDLQKY